MTTKKISCILLVPILLGSISLAKPAPGNGLNNIALLKTNDLCLQKTKYTYLEPSENDGNLSPSNQLLKFTLKSFQELSLNYAKRAKNISEHLLKDSTVLTNQSPKMLEFKHNITEYHRQYTVCDNLDELFDIVELYSNTTSFYYELEESSLDTDSKLILSLLRKYGSEDLDNEFEKYFNVFVENFDKKLEGLKPDLKKEEDQVGVEVLEWFETFKTLTNYDDKIAAFEKYFKFYDDKTDKNETTKLFN